MPTASRLGLVEAPDAFADQITPINRGCPYFTGTRSNSRWQDVGVGISPVVPVIVTALDGKRTAAGNRTARTAPAPQASGRTWRFVNSRLLKGRPPIPCFWRRTVK